MRGAVLYAPGDIRVDDRDDDRDDPTIVEPTDAVIRMAATCVCGSDLWPYRGIEEVNGPSPMGHEYVGVIEEVGSKVRNVKPGQFVVGSFFASDNTCEICRAGYQTSCVQRQPGAATGAQASTAGSRWPTAPSSPPRTSRRPTWSRACSRPRTCSVPAGSAPSPPRWAPAGPSRSWVTARSASSASWRRSSSAPSGSSR